MRIRRTTAVAGAWLLAAALLAPVGIGAVAPAAAEPATSPSTPSGGSTVECAYRPTPDKPPARPVHPPRSTAPAHGKITWTLVTNYGPLVLKLDRSGAPCAVNSIVHLTRSGFYDVSRCWRLTDSERLGVLQCGDIYAAEEGGPGYEFDDELTGEETYPRGTVALGNWGPDTNSSQFFAVHSHANIPPAYPIIGQVTRGMPVLDAIVAGGIAGGEDDGEPARPVRILKALALPGW